MYGSDRLLKDVMKGIYDLLQKLEDAGKLVDHCVEILHRRLQVVVMRPQEALKDFGDFYCLRLVLDQQSSLASFFIDFFSHLEFLLLHLDPARQSIFVESLDRVLKVLQPITSTCRLLYATCNMLPTTCGPHVAGEEFKREGQRQGRQFSSNLLHCRMQYMPFVYRDQPGCSRVTLVEQLGTGTSATVYKGAFKLPLDRGQLKPESFVAVKMFKDSDLAGSSALAFNSGRELFQSMQQMTNSLEYNFVAELEKLVVAKHPNIVTPKGYIGKRPEAGECGIVMELMDESLFDHLEKVNDGWVTSLKEVDMLDLMLEIARGMRFLHECKLIHLDLKPKNILLRFSLDKDHPPEVKLADLGLTTLSALFQEEICPPTTPLGTSCYMAPEIRGASSERVHYDDKVDVFSYGTTCFNIIVGNPDPCAFSKSIPHFYEAIKTGSWKQWVHGCNPFLVKLIGRCWEMDPSKRPTFATLCILLQRVMQSLLAPSFLRSKTEWLCSFVVTRRWLNVLNEGGKHFHCETSIAISQYYPISNQTIQLKEIKKALLHFEAHGHVFPTDTNLSRIEGLLEMAERLFVNDDDEDGCTIVMNASPFFKQRGLRSEGHFQIMIERCLNDADPLLWIKAEAFLSLLGLRVHSRYADKGKAELMQSRAFDYCKDEAHAPLEVDTSLVPLLVSFWSTDVVPHFWRCEPMHGPRADRSKTSKFLFKISQLMKCYQIK